MPCLVLLLALRDETIEGCHTPDQHQYENRPLLSVGRGWPNRVNQRKRLVQVPSNRWREFFE